MDLSKLIHGLLSVLTWMICLNWYMDLLQLLGAVHILYNTHRGPKRHPPHPLLHNIWTAPYLDLSKLFGVLLALSQTKTSRDWPKFQSLLKLLLWTFKVLIEYLGHLGLWQCFCKKTKSISRSSQMRSWHFPSCKLCLGGLQAEDVSIGYFDSNWENTCKQPDVRMAQSLHCSIQLPLKLESCPKTNVPAVVSIPRSLDWARGAGTAGRGPSPGAIDWNKNMLPPPPSPVPPRMKACWGNWSKN